MDALRQIQQSRPRGGHTLLLADYELGDSIAEPLTASFMITNGNPTAEPLTAEHQNKLREEIELLIKGQPLREKNFFRRLTNVACPTRHHEVTFSDLENLIPLDNGQVIGRHPRGPIGVLDPLPAVAIDSLFMHMDMETLMTFRSVCSKARAWIDNLPAYRGIMKHAPQILRAALAIKAAQFVTLGQLDSALMSKTCRDCGNFGAFLHILTGDRVCYRCFNTNNKRMLLSESCAAEILGVTQYEFDNVQDKKFISSIPGSYWNTGSDWDTRPHDHPRARYMGFEEGMRVKMLISGKSREEVIEEFETRQAARGPLTICREFDAYRRAPLTNMLMGPCTRDMLKSTTGPPHCSGAPYEEGRRIVMVGMPWVSSRAMDADIEWGVACNGCYRVGIDDHKDGTAEEQNMLDNQVKLYSKAGFIDHLMVCPFAQERLCIHWKEIETAKEELRKFKIYPCEKESLGGTECDMAV